MYEEFFSFSGSPFRLAPDPKFFFGSKSHNKAMAYLHYGLRQAEGFIVITGEIGAGKSILIGHLLDQLDRSNVRAATLATPNLSPEELLAQILSAFRVEPAGKGRSAEIEAFEDFLFDQMNHGRRVLLVIDEAQNLPLKTLEELRVLSNLSYEGTPLFQVFLIGQPDFRETMARADMEQLRQRVIATYHLEPMSREETQRYVEHRLKQVGWDGDPKIAADAFAAIHAATGGVPRKIHKLCNRALLYCSVEKVRLIDGAVVAAVLADLAAEQNAASAVDAEDRLDFDAGAAVKAAALNVGPPPLVEGAKPIRARTVNPIHVGVESVDLHVEDGINQQSNGTERVPAPKRDPMTEKEEPEPQDRAAREPSPTTEGRPALTSVFDRLRAAKTAAKPAGPAPSVRPADPQPKTEADAPPPRPATLDEVADAIAAARPSRMGADEIVEAEYREVPDAGVTASEKSDASEEAATEVEEAAGWRHSVVMSINDTREELRRAHDSVGRLRRQLTEIDRRRRKRRVKIAESLDRAESLLTEFQNAWR